MDKFWGVKTSSEAAPRTVRRRDSFALDHERRLVHQIFHQFEPTAELVGGGGRVAPRGAVESHTLSQPHSLTPLVGWSARFTCAPPLAGARC
jgi:hypothetical protein